MFNIFAFIFNLSKYYVIEYRIFDLMKTNILVEISAELSKCFSHSVNRNFRVQSESKNRAIGEGFSYPRGGYISPLLLPPLGYKMGTAYERRGSSISFRRFIHSDLQKPGRVAQSEEHLTRKSEVLGSIPGLATYFRSSFR